MKTKSSVTKTASDALLAKWSAISAEHEPVARNSKIYSDLLQKMVSCTTSSDGSHYKRQTPLVNAGYAARIGVVTSMVEKFVLFHSNSNHDIQLVFLGCGLDVLGLWSASLCADDRIRVYEVDVPDICKTKRDVIVSLGLLRLSEGVGKDDTCGHVVAQGVIELNESEHGINSSLEDATAPNYVLLSADLRDRASLQMSLAMFDASRPTLVVSELVLAYLGQRGTDSLLEYCASHLSHAPNSALFLYEPLGAGECTTGVCSVTEGYKQTYDSQFASKLERGTAQRGDSAADESYHPLGTTCVQVERRLRQAGFSSSHACLAGTAAALSSCALTSTELFDEHAALALHLRTYAVECAFSDATKMELKRQMCPWSRRITIDDAVSFTTDNGISILPIELSHQEKVRNLFEETYKDLFEEYPAVRKMVKTALKTDLSGKTDAMSQDMDINASTIGNRYEGWGGVFVVATEKTMDIDNGECCPVVGCVGMRPCGRYEVSARGFGKNPFEIHRLAVDARSRERGIGRALLSAVERFAKVTLRRDSPYTLVATTPAMLKAANQLYQSVRFRLEDEVLMGNISMITYVKECVTASK